MAASPRGARSWTPPAGSRCSSSPPAPAATWVSRRPPSCCCRARAQARPARRPGRPGSSTPTPRRCSPAGRDRRGRSPGSGTRPPRTRRARPTPTSGWPSCRASRCWSRTTTDDAGRPPTLTAGRRSAPAHRRRPQDRAGGVLSTEPLRTPLSAVARAHARRRGHLGRPPTEEGHRGGQRTATTAARVRARQRGAPRRAARRSSRCTARAAQRGPARVLPVVVRCPPARAGAQRRAPGSTPSTARPGGGTCSAASARPPSRATWSSCTAACGAGSGGSGAGAASRSEVEVVRMKRLPPSG